MAIRRIKCDNSDVFIHHCAAAAHQTRFSPTRYAEMKTKLVTLSELLEYYRVGEVLQAILAKKVELE
jgi:hypothetical protein